MAYKTWVNLYLPDSFFWVFMTFKFFYQLIQDIMKKLMFQKSDTNASNRQSFNSDKQYLLPPSVVWTKKIALGVYLLVVFGLTLTLILLIITF